MTTSPRQTHARIFATLDGVRRSIRAAAGLRGALLVTALLGGIVVGSLAVDRLFRLGVPARAVLLAAYVAALAWLAWKVVARPLLARLSSRALADLVERRRPELQDRLRSAVDFVRDARVAAEAPPRDGESDLEWDLELALKRSVVGEAESLCGTLGAIDVVDHRALGRSTLAGAFALLVVAVVFLFAPEGTASLWLHRNVLLGDVEWPYRTRLMVQGFGEERRRGVARGDGLVIDVEAVGEIPDRAWIDLDYERDRRRYNLTRIGERLFRHAHPEVREPFTFRVHGGDYSSPRYGVDVLERPQLESLRVTQVFPDYIGAEPRVAEGAVGDLAVPVGTTLRLEAVSSKGLERAFVELAESTVELDIDASDARRFSGELTPERSESLRLGFVDVEGVVPDSPLVLQVRLVPDRAPAIKLRTHGIGSMVSAQARIPLRVEITDDYRVDAVSLAHDVGERLLVEGADAAADETTPAPPPTEGASPAESAPPAGDGAASPPRGAFSGATALDGFETSPLVNLAPDFEVAELGIEPERRLTLSVRATDNDTLNGPNQGVSSSLEFLVVSHQKLMDDFLRRQEDQRESFERLVEREQTIRDALYEAVDGALERPGDLEKTAADELAAHARLERGMASQSMSIAAAIDMILTEMKNNRVGEADDIERIGSKVVVPLREIADHDLPEIAARLDSLRAETLAPKRVRDGLALAEDVDALIERMEGIVANMIKLESFSEIVNILRDIIKLENESREQARKAYEKLLDEDIFEK